MNDITYNFSPTLKIKFTYFQGDYFANIEEKGKNHRIPLLLGSREVSLAMYSIKDVKGLDLPFKTFCQVVTGYLSTILKYKARSGPCQKPQNLKTLNSNNLLIFFNSCHHTHL
jgi:hypothetical protein